MREGDPEDSLIDCELGPAGISGGPGAVRFGSEASSSASGAGAAAAGNTLAGTVACFVVEAVEGRSVEGIDTAALSGMAAGIAEGTTQADIPTAGGTSAAEAAVTLEMVVESRFGPPSGGSPRAGRHGSAEAVDEATGIVAAGQMARTAAGRSAALMTKKEVMGTDSEQE